HLYTYSPSLERERERRGEDGSGWEDLSESAVPSLSHSGCLEKVNIVVHDRYNYYQQHTRTRIDVYLKADVLPLVLGQYIVLVRDDRKEYLVYDTVSGGWEVWENELGMVPGSYAQRPDGSIVYREEGTRVGYGEAEAPTVMYPHSSMRWAQT
ncbi:hypothetical protein KIPB_011096, partial [Kipferlia bialata]